MKISAAAINACVSGLEIIGLVLATVRSEAVRPALVAQTTHFALGRNEVRLLMKTCMNLSGEKDDE